MSAAVIRKCNRCANPFIKQSGCNKITCTRCRAIQCYVCRKTVKDYSHFDDSDRGGKAGQCPLFDSTEDRHQNEVRAAEEVAREKVTQENPDVDAEKFEINVSDRVKADEDQRKQQQASHVRPGVVRAMPQAQQALQDMIIARQQAAGNRQALVPPPGIAAAEIRPALRAYEAPRFQFVEPPAVRPHQPPPAAQRRLGHVPSGFVQLADHAGQRPRPIVGRQNERRAVLDHALPPIENMRQTIHASGNQRLRLGNEIPFPPPQADPFMGALLPLHDNAIPFQQFLGFGEQPFGGNNLGDLRDEIERLAGVRSVGHAVESQRQRQAGNAERTQQLLESTKQRNQQRASESQRQAQRAVDIRRRMPVLQSPPQRPGANGNGMVGLQRRQERMLGQVRELQLAQEQVNHPHPLPVPERRALASYLPVGLLAGRPPAPHGFPRAPAADLRGTGA